MRTCIGCGESKPLEAFTGNRGTPWRHRRCKPCRAFRALAARHPNEDAEALRLRQLQRKQPRPADVPRCRTCKRCGEIKPIEMFTPLDGNRYWRTECKACRAAREKARYLRAPKPRLQWPPGTRTCTKCGATKPLDQFQRIRQRKSAYYGACRDCRNAKARARYHRTADIRGAEIARSLRNKRARSRVSLRHVAIVGPPQLLAGL